MEIGVIGTGYVGLTTGTMLADLGHDVICCDIDEAKIESLKSGKVYFYEPGLETLVTNNIKRGTLSFTHDVSETISNTDVIFVCVGTPEQEDGSPNMTYFTNVMDSISRFMNGYKVIVVKSTVPIGTHIIASDILAKGNHAFDLVSNPEFLREGSAVDDSFNGDRIVIGTSSEKARAIMLSIFSGLSMDIVCVDNTTAELIKYASNGFLAMKISYINMLSQLCDSVGADVKKVAEAMGKDKRIGSDFLRAGLGYGGSCFGKDVSALIHMCKNQQVKANILEATMAINNEQIAYVANKMDVVLGGLKNKKVCILGFSFKPETDDIRDAPSIKLIKKLKRKGAKIVGTDPHCSDKINSMFPFIKIFCTAEEAAKNADVIILVTEWEEYIKANWAVIAQQMKTPIVFDGRNALNRLEMESAGFTYYGIGT